MFGIMEILWLIGGGIAQEDEVKHGDIVAHWRWGSSKRCSESWSMEIEGLVGGGMA